MLHTPPLVYGIYSCAYWGNLNLTYFCLSTMHYLDILTYTSFPGQISKTTGLITAILHIQDLKGP